MNGEDLDKGTSLIRQITQSNLDDDKDEDNGFNLPNPKDGSSNILVKRRATMAQKQILKQTTVRKKYGLKQLLQSKRQLYIYKDGMMAYTEKNDIQKIKQEHIDPKEIVKITRRETTIQIIIEKTQPSSAYLMTGASNDQDSQQPTSQKQINHSFKFGTVDEAKEWYKLICTFIIISQQEQD